MGDGKLNQHHEDKKHTHNHPVIQVANIADLKTIKAFKFIRNIIYFGIKIIVIEIVILRSHSYLTFGVFCRTPLNIAMRVKSVIITMDILPGMAVGSTAIESQAIITNKLCLNRNKVIRIYS